MMDAIEIEVMRHLFSSIAEEMGVALMRSAFSPNIKERRDYSCAIFDRHGEMVAQAAHIPVHLGSTPRSVEAVLRAFPQGVPEGEHVLVNDPYDGGTHLPDLTLVASVYGDDGALCFHVANRAHHADVGGISPGSLPLSSHIDEEGFRTAPALLDDALIQALYEASRTPDEREGDLHAQVSANRRGVERLKEHIRQRGERILDASSGLQDYSERIMRAFIARLPNGTWRAEDVLEDDGRGHESIRIVCAVEVNDEEMTFDFTSSAPQTEGPLNVPGAVTESAVLYVMCCLLAEHEVPVNHGLVRPLHVKLREGSVVCARYPSPVAAGNVETSQRVTDVVFRALANLLPERVPAASCGTMNNVLIGGVDHRDNALASYAYYETIGGGSGAGPHGDGGSGMQTHMTNTLNTPVEVLEHAYPFMVTRYALRKHSGGEGLYRGGDGVERVYRFLGDATVTLMTERRVERPWGLRGGGEGALGENALQRAGSALTTRLPGKITLDVSRGDELAIMTPGGGGWGAAGDPSPREPEG